MNELMRFEGHEVEGEIDGVRIPLTRGAVAIVDACDARFAQEQWLAGLGWGSSLYAMRGRREVDGPGPHMILLHREILPPPPGFQVDHIDRDTLNCRRANLRLVSPAENARNRGPNRNNTSGFKGVNWRPDVCRWRATIMVDGKSRHLGHFATAGEAARAYDAAALTLHGEFAYLNFAERRPGLRGVRRLPKARGLLALPGGHP